MYNKIEKDDFFKLSEKNFTFPLSTHGSNIIGGYKEKLFLLSPEVQKLRWSFCSL